MANQIIVESGPHHRLHCPITADLPDGLTKKKPDLVRLFSDDSGNDPKIDIPGQVSWHETSDDNSGTSGRPVIHAILPSLEPYQQLTLNVEFLDSSPERGVKVSDDGDGHVAVEINGELFTSYYYGNEWARPFFHPVTGPYGSSVTRGFPVETRPGEHEDHPHHKSLWVAHGDLNGADNWSEEKNSSRVKHLSLKNLISGPVFGSFTAINDWMDQDGKTLLTEERIATFYCLPSGLKLFDMQITFSASSGDVCFGDTKEGGILSVRVATSMDASLHGTIVQSTGAINESETWGKRAAWCDYYGPTDDGNEVGIAVMNHPDSFRYPTWWHVRNYGLMTANPFGWSDFYGSKDKDGGHTLLANEALYFAYRVFIHPGSTESADVSGRFMDYIHAPKTVTQ